MLLLIVLSCLKFAISYGFRFDGYPGIVTVGIPITVFWHRDNETDDIRFDGVNNSQGSPQGDIILAGDASQPHGTLNVTFPSPGQYTIRAIKNQTNTVVAVTQIYAPPNVSLTAMNPSPRSSSSETSVQSAKITASDPPKSDSTDQDHNRKHERSIIIGAVTGSLVSLMLILGGGTILFIRRRKHRSLKHRISPNPKIIFQRQSILPPHPSPAGAMSKENGATISPMFAGEMAPSSTNLQEGHLRMADRDLEGSPTEDERQRRDDISTVFAPLPVRPSEPREPQIRRSTQQVGPQTSTEEEGPHAGTAALGDVTGEILRLRTQVWQLLVRESERAQGNSFDSPPAYT
ncbi:uncharacterized protein EV420DRAFT_1770561 [Desarmillaria tabescens]|uniref:GOLD domain-containing protein n=1 Tax=Armillaria tabescens TaxID=1929756 RepID=A0AA39J5A9_ARMTA|nr:uncharacterized protein EV420DRAFT_1770561 [Desarmillaria tabescens]KAK0435567.1 hypothetical protein EV420DRAFT_1770561 [Desarmillaria tabescens]